MGKVVECVLFEFLFHLLYLFIVPEDFSSCGPHKIIPVRTNGDSFI